jgi:hypothetical protein
MCSIIDYNMGPHLRRAGAVASIVGHRRQQPLLSLRVAFLWWGRVSGFRVTVDTLCLPGCLVVFD